MNQSPPQLSVLLLHRTNDSSSEQWLQEIAAKIESYSGDPAGSVNSALVVPISIRSQQTVESAIAEQKIKSSVKNLELIIMLEPSFATWTWPDYQHLQTRYPLARVVTLTGPWAAGGARSNLQWSGSHHLPNMAFELQFQQFHRQFVAGERTLWDGPATQSVTQRLAAGNIAPACETGCRIGVVGTDFSMLDALQKACVALGHSVSCSAILSDWTDSSTASDGQQPDLWIWDWVKPKRESTQLSLVQPFNRPIIILLGYAEIELCSEQSILSQLIDVKIVRKPFLMDELQTAIRDLSFQDR